MNHNHTSRHPEDREPDLPGWDLPISLSEAEALGRRLDTAGDADTIITTQDAQTIARCLSDRLQAGPHSSIRQFGDLGSIRARELRAECLAAHTADGFPPGLKRWAAWLVAYAAHALPPEMGGLQIPSNGDALDTFLHLPDLKLTGDTTLKEFAYAYCGSFVDIDGVLEGITEVLDWERKIRSLATDLGCEAFVSIDRNAIERQMREGWDIVPGRGGLHVFLR